MPRAPVHFPLAIGYHSRMPEVEVAGEPLTGLRVVADQKKPAGQPGFYALVQESEWHSDNRKVTLWRGPDMPDEKVSRKRLTPVDCRTVLVDPLGYYDCLPDLDLLQEEVVPLAEKIMTQEADRRAAETWSTVHDDLQEAYGDDVWVMASFGDQTAVNGDLVGGPRKPPRGWVRPENHGGRIYDGGEEEVEMEWLAEVISEQLGNKLLRPVYPGTVLEILVREYGDKHYIVWSSSSGDSEVWVSKKALKAYEKEQEETATLTEEGRARRRQEQYEHRLAQEAAERRRLEEERRLQTRRGGYPSRQDWSPSGRLPGEPV